MQQVAKSLSRPAFSHPAGSGVESKAPECVDTLITSDVFPRHERVALLVELVGGLSRAAALAEVSPATISNWRKPGATLQIDGVLALCLEAGVSLDWLATGHMVRPDLVGQPEEAPQGVAISASLVRLIDLRVAAALRREARV